MSKLSAARVEFGHRGMLTGDVLIAARIDVGLAEEAEQVPPVVAYEKRYGIFDDVEADNGPQAEITTKLATKSGPSQTLVSLSVLMKDSCSSSTLGITA